jgi:uncharacterized membrane protein YebE (DUF533 family)
MSVMTLSDRILPLCDVLLGAAYADRRLADAEREKVRGLIRELTGGLPAEAEARITSFDPARFDVAAAAAPFAADPEEDRRRLLVLVTAVIDADDEVDLAEDAYLRALAAALKLPKSALAGLTVDVESEELVASFAKMRKGPPPPPPKKN